MSDRRDILERVARGELSPDEAAERLREIAPETPPPPPPPPPPDGTEQAVRRVRVVGSFRTTRIIGDPDVREVSVDGPHVVRRTGDLLVVEDDRDIEVEQDRVHAAAGTGEGRFRFTIGGKRHTIFGSSFGSGPKPIEIRMNPDLPLDVELAAGTLHVRDVRSRIRADISAGTARIEGIVAPIDVKVAAGSVHVSGVLDHGDSSVRCEAGAVKIDLAEGSSVRMTVRTTLGKVTLPDREGAVVSLGGEAYEQTIGDGAGTLDIETSLGKVDVRVQR